MNSCVFAILTLLLLYHSLRPFALEINIGSCECDPCQEVELVTQTVVYTQDIDFVALDEASFMEVVICGGGGAGGNGLDGIQFRCGDSGRNLDTIAGGGGGGGGSCITQNVNLGENRNFTLRVGRGGDVPSSDGGDTTLMGGEGVMLVARGGKGGKNATIEYVDEIAGTGSLSSDGGDGGSIEYQGVIFLGGKGGHNCIQVTDCGGVTNCQGGHVYPEDGREYTIGCTGGGGGQGFIQIIESVFDHDNLHAQGGGNSCGFRGGIDHGEGGGGGASSFPGASGTPGYPPSEAGNGGGRNGNPTPGRYGGGGGGGNTRGAGAIGAAGGDGIARITYYIQT